MTELEPVAWMDDGTTRTGSDSTGFRVVHANTKATMPNASAINFTVALVTLSSATAAIAERDKRIAELESERDEMHAAAERQWEGWVREQVRAKAAEAEATSLRGLLEKARKVIEPFASLAHQYDPPEGDDWETPYDLKSGELTIGHLRAARTWMEKNR